MINYYLINFLYTLLFLPLATARVLIKAIKNPAYKKGLAERYAIYSCGNNRSIRKNDKRVDLWVHTVSVGEFIAAKPLLIELIVRTNIKVLITCTTPTGSALIEKFIEEYNLKDNINKTRLSHCYYPYDSNIICSRFLKVFRPKLAVFFETEIWPKMFRQTKKHHIKLLIINARLSEKSYKSYAKFIKYFQNILPCIDYVATQGQNDCERFLKLGIPADKIAVFGNIKYNIRLPLDLNEQSEKYKNILFSGRVHKNLERLVLIAASTHQGEDEILLDVYLRLKEKYNNLVLIIVPRHPERFQQVYNLCVTGNITYKTHRFSELGSQNKIIEDTDIFLLDTMGQLLYFYNISDVAFIGGSLNQIGGHNPLEPAILKVASIIGPYYHNFTEIVDNLQKAEGLLVANSAIDLHNKIDILLSDKSYRAKIGINACNAMNVMTEHQQGLNKYFNLIVSNLTRD